MTLSTDLNAIYSKIPSDNSSSSSSPLSPSQLEIPDFTQFFPFTQPFILPSPPHLSNSSSNSRSLLTTLHCSPVCPLTIYKSLLLSTGSSGFLLNHPNSPSQFSIAELVANMSNMQVNSQDDVQVISSQQFYGNVANTQPRGLRSAPVMHRPMYARPSDEFDWERQMQDEADEERQFQELQERIARASQAKRALDMDRATQHEITLCDELLIGKADARFAENEKKKLELKAKAASALAEERQHQALAYAAKLALQETKRAKAFQILPNEVCPFHFF